MSHCFENFLFNCSGHNKEQNLITANLRKPATNNESSFLQLFEFKTIAVNDSFPFEKLCCQHLVESSPAIKKDCHFNIAQPFFNGVLYMWQYGGNGESGDTDKYGNDGNVGND